MADKFNFGRVASVMKSVEREFLTKGVELAREEAVLNIESQVNSETGEEYPEITYIVAGGVKPPPRLILTGDLFDEVKGNPIEVRGNEAKLVIDPIDERGKGYASYHQDGENNYKSKDEFQSEFITQSSNLAEKQVRLLETLVNNSFQ